MSLTSIAELGERVRSQIGQVVIGQTRAINFILVALLAEGHVLLEGMPGTAKTMLARTFAASLALDFNRIQFTPDLMPGDVLGTNLFDFRSSSFKLTKGPIFTEILLSDEINRTPPKTQAALLQAMQERMVTIDGTTHDLGPGFMVLATQNPLEQEGTYPLPEAQLDRFLFKINIGYPSRDNELELVRVHGHRSAMPSLNSFNLKPVADLQELLAARELVREIVLSDELIAYVVDIVRATRENPSLTAGASPRAANMLATAARAFAALSGRDYVLPDDVKKLAPATLSHRVVLSPAAEIEGRTSDSVVRDLIKSVKAPR
ncbi:MAG: AAA family ATPase [Planctomycetota bacterium]|jgi:MoxR-like ATPase